MPTSQGFRGLRVYQLAFRLAMEIFYESKNFLLKRGTRLLTKSDELRAVFLQISVRVTEENNIRRCS